MNLYLVNRTDEWSYDDYDAFVCVTDSEESAKNTSPQTDFESNELKKVDWSKKDIYGFHGWTNSKDNVKVTLLALNVEGPERMILASFNAG